MGRRNPVDSALDLAAVRALPAPALGVVHATQLLHIARLIQHSLAAGDEIGIAQTHFRAGKKAVEFLGRVLAEIVVLDIQLARERHFAAAVVGVFRMVGHLEFLHLPFRIILDNHLDGVQHGHGARGSGVEVLPDAEFQHGVIHNGIGAG